MSRNEMVSVPRQQLKAWQERFSKAQIFKESTEVQSVLDQPAEQHQGEPVALPERKPESVSFYPTGWNACLDEIAKLGPLYTHPAPADQQGYPSEDELIANGLGYPISKEDAVRLHYAGYRSEVITILEAWEAIGHDIHINPDKQELLDSLRNMAAICSAHGFDMPSDPGEVERLRATNKEALAELEDRKNEIYALRAQLAERDAHPIRALSAEAYSTLVGMVEFCLSQRTCMGMDEGFKSYEPEVEHDFVKELRSFVTLSASAEPSAPECKGWTCFHCDEHFTDAEAAAIHFGTHEIQRPACLIDAAEYRSMEARVRECANEDSELHRQMSRLASNHKLELQRAEESGYAKGIAESSALPDPLGCHKCAHADCGKFDGPRQVECRAMADNACARPGASS